MTGQASKEKKGYKKALVYKKKFVRYLKKRNGELSINQIAMLNLFTFTNYIWNKSVK